MSDTVILRVEHLEELTINLIEVCDLFSCSQINIFIILVSLVYQVEDQLCLGWLVYKKPLSLYVHQYHLYPFTS